VITVVGKSEMMPPGRYECELQRVAGQWAFQAPPRRA